MQAKSMKIIKTFGDLIKDKRLNLKKSVYAISAECGISKSTWQRIEDGHFKNISIITMWKISEALDIPIEKLISEVRKILGADFSLID